MDLIAQPLDFLAQGDEFASYGRRGFGRGGIDWRVGLTELSHEGLMVFELDSQAGELGSERVD